MPNIQQVMSEEIRRLARKELKTELTEMKKQFAAMRKLIVEQNRRIKALEKLAPGIIQESKTAWQKDGDLMEFLKALQVKYK